jgi:hypothetical protein
MALLTMRVPEVSGARDAENCVRLSGAVVDSFPGMKTIVRGILNPQDSEFLQYEDYQRDYVSDRKIDNIRKGYNGDAAVPAIYAAVEGANYYREGLDIVVAEPVFVVDGKQRTLAAIREASLGKYPYILMLIHLDTDYRWRRDEFKALNAPDNRTSVGASVTMRNEALDSTAVALIYKMTLDDLSFVMRGKIGWNQSMRVGDLVSGKTLCQSASLLHKHLRVYTSTNAEKLAAGLQQVADKIGLDSFINNIRTFYDIIERCWSIRDIVIKDGNPQVNTTWLFTASAFLSDHINFWDGDDLSLSRDQVTKLKAFPIHDTNIRRLCGSGSRNDSDLYTYLVKHFNHGARGSTRLRERE